ncbi:hypothetical protein ABZ297_18170 [Nonomuraea sp. NPDC005983]|uniref:hypothetical protein n=1 Tax=Nonomuraea sp. NPDC005983 TaxID=3155595 RepID=UPI0033A16DE9
MIRFQLVIVVRIRRAAIDRWLSALQYGVSARRQSGLSTVIEGARMEVRRAMEGTRPMPSPS